MIVSCLVMDPELFVPLASCATARATPGYASSNEIVPHFSNEFVPQHGQHRSISASNYS